MFTAALFTTAKLWKQPRCPTTDGLRKCGIYTQWNFTAMKLDGTGEHHPEQG
jgi:hypothetical protein